MFPESHEKLLVDLLSIRRIPHQALEAEETALHAERDRARRRRALEADRAPRRMAEKLYPPVGRIDCPDCGCSSRGERFHRYVPILDIEQIEYQCDKCGAVYQETEVVGQECDHLHDCVECGTEYLCNAPTCRDGQYSDGHCRA